MLFHARGLSADKNFSFEFFQNINACIKFVCLTKPYTYQLFVEEMKCFNFSVEFILFAEISCAAKSSCREFPCVGKVFVVKRFYRKYLEGLVLHCDKSIFIVV